MPIVKFQEHMGSPFFHRGDLLIGMANLVEEGIKGRETKDNGLAMRRSITSLDCTMEIMWKNFQSVKAWDIRSRKKRLWLMDKSMYYSLCGAAVHGPCVLVAVRIL